MLTVIIELGKRDSPLGRAAYSRSKIVLVSGFFKRMRVVLHTSISTVVFGRWKILVLVRILVVFFVAGDNKIKSAVVIVFMPCSLDILTIVSRRRGEPTARLVPSRAINYCQSLGVS